MGYWQIVTPLAMTNHALNPSFENNTTGWSDYADGGAAGTRTRLAEAAHQGFYGYRIAKSGTTGNYGVTHGSTDPTVYVSGDSVTYSIYCTVASGARISMYCSITTAGTSPNGTVTQDGPFTGRIELTLGPLDATGITDLVRITVPSTYEGTIDIDGLQIEVNDEATTYFDGDTPGAYWEGKYHLSRSLRRAERPGGQVENFDDYAFYIIGTQGTGVADLKPNYDILPLQDGALFRQTQVGPRTFTLVGELIGSSWADLHDKRRALFDLFKPDLKGIDEPFWLQYTGSGETLQILARYVGGMAGGNAQGFSERISLQFVAVEPYFQRDYNRGITLTNATSYAGTLKHIIAKINGEWDDFGLVGPNNYPLYAVVVHEGYIYVGGNFTEIDGDTDMAYIARYSIADGWEAMGAGANGAVRALALDEVGNLYAGGDFTSMDGVSNTQYAARWDIATEAWESISAPATAAFNGAVYAICVTPNGKVFYGGDFTTAGGGAAVRIASQYTYGTAFTAYGSGLNTIVRALAAAPNSDVYVGGDFTNGGGEADGDYIVKISYASPYPYSGLSTGMDDVVRAIAVADDGTVYAGGDFTTAGGVTVAAIASFNGVTWDPMNGGTNSANPVYALKILEDGRLAIGGAFENIGGVIAYRVAVWTGTYYQPYDIFPTGGLTIYAIGEGAPYEIVFVGAFSYLDIAYAHSLTNNGTRATWIQAFWIPEYDDALYAFYPMTIESYPLRAVISFSFSMPSLDRVTLSTEPGNVSLISRRFGSRVAKINRGSDVAGFRLLPGANTLLFLASGADFTFTGALIWFERYWAADGSS